VVSDWNGHGQVRGCTNQSCAQAINAGIDIVMVPRAWKPLFENTLRQVKEGEIPESRIDEAVTRILKIKAAAGILDRDKPSVEAQPVADAIGHPDHRAIAREAVRQSLVLLKNKEQALPLSPSGTFLIAGPAADDIERQSGGWTISWQGTGNANGDFPDATSIADGFAQQIAEGGGTLLRETDDVVNREIDAVIYVFGETPYAEGQGDIDSLAWQQGAHQDLAALKKWRELGVPVVSVFVTGRPRWVNAEINASDAFVVAWLPGSEGAGIADVLLTDTAGDVRHAVSGKLPFPWPAHDVHPTHPQQPVEEAVFPVGYGLAYGEAGDVPVLSEIANGKPTTGALPLIAGGVRESFSLIMGEVGQQPEAVPPAGGRAANGRIAIEVFDHRVQEDARRTVWSGSSDASDQFGILSDEPLDLSRWLVRGGVLEMELRLASTAAGNVMIRMQCGEDCEGPIDITPLLADTALDEWFSLAIPLSCFDEAGADIERVSAPMLISSDGALTLDVADVRIAQRASDNAVVWCPFHL
jgi:beta-glucosidase